MRLLPEKNWEQFYRASKRGSDGNRKSPQVAILPGHLSEQLQQLEAWRACAMQSSHSHSGSCLARSVLSALPSVCFGFFRAFKMALVPVDGGDGRLNVERVALEAYQLLGKAMKWFAEGCAWMASC